MRPRSRDASHARKSWAQPAILAYHGGESARIRMFHLASLTKIEHISPGVA